MQFKFKVLLSSPFKRHLKLYKVCTIQVTANSLKEANTKLAEHGHVERVYSFVRTAA